MAIQLDTTAHPLGAAITAAGDVASGNPNLTSPTFSSLAGNRWLVVSLFADSGSAPFPVTVSGAGLSWAQVKSAISTTFLNASGVAQWMAFASGALVAQTVTAAFQNNTSTLHYSMDVKVLFDDAAGFTSTSPLGASASLVDDSGSNVSVNLTVTPAATGSWLIGAFSTTNDGAGLTADSNTSAFDFTRFTTDSTAFGRYKVAGAVATTTASTPVTFGASTSNAFDYCCAIEIKLPTGGGSSFTSTQTETASPTASFALGSIAGAASETESTSASASFAAATAGSATQAETTTPDSLFAGAMAIPATQAESAQALDAYAFQLIIAAAQAETATPSVAFATAQAMGATFIASTSPSVSFDDGASPPRRTAGFPFWPWWYRLQPFNRKRIM